MWFRQIEDRQLAQYAYLIGCQQSDEAIIIDPMRDVDMYVEAAAREGLRLVAAADTHIHADYLSGLRELAERGITVYASADGGPDWRYEWLHESTNSHQLLSHGDRFSVGNIQFETVHTPGHTPEHICFLVTDGRGGAGTPMGILSGDLVFVGAVGRPDLLETAAGQRGAMEPAARELFRSIGRFCQLPDHLQVWPAHGSGSACGKDLGAVPLSTVGYEKAFNASILAATDEDAFVAHILDGQQEPPLYFGRMKIQNRRGPAVLGPPPQPRLMHQGKLSELSGAVGVAVLDTRPWESYRSAHLPGALFAPLNKAFNTIAGCYVPADMAVYLIVDEPDLQGAVVDLVHVGLDRVMGYATPEMFVEYIGSGGKVTRVGEIDAQDFDERVAGAFLLDVRGEAELAEFGHVEGAHQIAYTRLLERLDEVPAKKPVIVYCETGARSSYACGLLARMGRNVSNVAGGFVAWQQNGGVAAR